MISGFVSGIIIGVIAVSIILGTIFYFFSRRYARVTFERWKQEELSKEIARALNAQRSIVKGQVSEKLFPLVTRRFGDVADFRFVGDPIDYVVFQGLSDKDSVNGKIHIKFIEVKTGSSKLNLSERLVKDAVENKRVSWDEIRLNQ